MPYLKMTLNRPLSPARTRQVLADASQKIAQELNKPENYVMVELNINENMLFAGSDEPTAYLELKSIGLPAVALRPLSRILCSFLSEEVDIDPARIYIEFTDIKGTHWGWNGTTF